MSVEISEIAKGVQGYYIENNRFNTTLLSYNFYLPLNSENMATNSLLVYILTSCSEEFRDYIALNTRLLELYGADLSCSVGKSGDYMHIKIGISVISDIFAFDSSSPVLEASELISGLLFAPAIENNSFYKKDIDREKHKTIERIEGEINNKRAFARTRLMEEMFGADPYGKFIYGSTSEVNAITGEQLYEAWNTLLKSAYIRINVVGKDRPDFVFEKAKDLFSSIKRENITVPGLFREVSPVDTPRIVTERLDITQGKIALGFTSNLHGGLRETAALSLFSDIFGGGPYSKLFENVREKQSLCYYCSASSRRSKGIVTVESGIEELNADKVVSAVMKELEDMKQGKIDDSKILASKKSVTDSLYGYYDNANAIDLWYSRDFKEDCSPNEAIDIINNVTKQEIIKVAKGVKLHTIYRLLPQNRGCK